MGRRAVNGSSGVLRQQRRNAKKSEARAPHVDKYAANKDRASSAPHDKEDRH
jgi:hypothetical protein